MLFRFQRNNIHTTCQITAFAHLQIPAAKLFKILLSDDLLRKKLI